ncbi:MAG: hypothetical protein JSV86_01000 [Gemmatimonadota bacterium]|nr:MAG: hypothetical protein JSV86_01000 [Gemmatimonadota bacterium]
MESQRRSIVVLLAWTVAACGGEESRWAGTITDSAGVTIVSSPAEGIWTEADRWTVEEDLKIGVVEGDPEYQFGEIGGITVDSRGRIFVLDVQAQHIRVFLPEGEYEQTIGRRGGGPGELDDARCLAMGTADTLLVLDLGNGRINRYAPNGSSIGSYRTAFEGRYALLSRSTPSGGIAVWLRSSVFQEKPERTDRIVVLSSGGTDTLFTFPSGKTFSLGEPSFWVMFYAPEAVWEITGDSKLLFGVNDQYRIGFYDSAELERVIEKPFEKLAITDAKEFHLAHSLTPRGRELTRFGEFYPAFNDIITGPSETIWVQHVRPVSELSDAERETLGTLSLIQRIITTLRDFHGAPDWDVFDAEGRYLGVVAMPERFAPKIFRGDKIYGVWRDNLNVQYVVRLRILGDLGVGAT